MIKLQAIIACCVLILLSTSFAFAQTQPWEMAYSDTSLNDENVIAAWHFDGDGKDASGNGHDLKLRGDDSHLVKDGKFGGALLVESNVETGDSRQGASTKNTIDLNPKGAFTIELWMSPSEQLAGKPYGVLLDKKYHIYASSSDKPTANTAYILALRKAANGQFKLEAQLGFGEDSVTVTSLPQTYAAGKWYHVAFTYDGKGETTFYLGAKRIGQKQLKDRGPITPGNYELVIGDRVGSTGHRFYGRIDEVRILNEAVRFVTGKVLLSITSSRTAFYRMENDAKIQVRVFNDSMQPLTNANVQINATGAFNRIIAVPDLAPGKSTFISIPLDTHLRPAAYEVTATLQIEGAKNTSNAIVFPFIVVPRPLPHQMPVVMWGISGKYQELTDIGFTSVFLNMTDYDYIWNNGETGTSVKDDRANRLRQRLDDMMAAQIRCFANLHAARPASSLHPEFNRSDRTNKEIKVIDGLYPEVQQFSYNVGASVARTFSDMPSWKGGHISTEHRDHTAPSFNAIDEKAYHKFSGQDIPSQVSAARGVSYKSLPGFPADHIIADDNPILTYYKWFWKTGDGWNKLTSMTNNGLKSTARNDILTFSDPAVRVPSIWGSGGNVDFLNQWTYTYPNPIKTALATDELFAMAEGRPGQKVMNMIQIIWYRNRTTETPINGQETEWEKVSPDAKFISIAPDHLSEATWLELARPVKAIAYYGWASLGDHLGSGPRSAKTTNVDTRKRMTHMLQNVVKPLAPTLLQVPGYKTDVAFLESFASQMFAGTGTYGWGGGWGADSYMIAQYASLQPRIVYAETIQQKGLDQYKVLFLTDCPILTESVAMAIKKFQERGGIVIGDENLAPGISPDILLTSIKRGAPDTTKAALLKKAAQLRGELDTFYQHSVESSNANVLTHLREFNDSQYIFTINDHRTYGDYVGQYKKVMEQGLPSQAQITLNTKASGFVYDLMNHHQVSTSKTSDKIQFDVDLGPGEGNLFLVTNKPIGKLQVSAPSIVKRGKSVPVKVLLRDNVGNMLHAVIPLEVIIIDSKGQIAERSGYFGAANGELQINLDIAPNSALGKWQIKVTEALTGQTMTESFQLK